MGSMKNYLKDLRNDGIDPRKNDVWRIVLFALNNSAGLSIFHLLGRWSYYTQNVLQLGVFLAAVILPMRLLDAITDPLIANWFDRFESKWGKFRPAMLAGALLSFIPALIIFLYPVESDIPMWGTYIILSACYAIIVIGNTILMTATRAGQAVITQDPRQRPLYSLGQTVFDGIIMMFVSIIVTGNVIGSMQEPTVWRVSIVILSVVSIVLVLIAMVAIKNRDNPTYYQVTTHDIKPKFRDFFLLMKTNKPLRSLLWATGSDALAASVRSTMTIYLFANILMNRPLVATFEVVTDLLIGLPFIFVGIFIASKKGSAFMYIAISKFQTIIAFLGFFVTMVFIPANPDYMYTGLTFRVITILLIFSLYISSLGISTNLINAMTGDLVDYEHSVSGRFMPGTIGATITFTGKIITSFVGLIIIGVMLFSGFSGTGASAVVPENVFVNARFHYSVLVMVFILPALGHLITWIAMRNYPLTLSKMQEITKELAKKRHLG